MGTLPALNNRALLQRPIQPFAMNGNVFNTRESGFTLLELLAVIFIIGIVTSIASISIGQRSSQVVQDEPQRLNGLLRLASEEAVMQGRELALEFSDEAYSFLKLDDNSRWLPVGDDKLLAERAFPPDINIKLEIEGATASFDDKKNLPRVFVLSSGELTPFTLTLSLEDEDAYVLQGEIDGRLILQNANENDIDA